MGKLPMWFEVEHNQKLSGWELEVSLEDVLRMQAADAGVIIQRNPALLGVAEQALQTGFPLLEPAVVFRILKVDRLRHESLILHHGFELRARLVAEHFKSADYIVAALCSIGGGVEREAKGYFRQDPVLALALEGFGSAAAETLATEFCALVEQRASTTGMASSIPLSPGMVGWPVDEGQRQLFNILDASLIGVELTQSSMMVPVKTISLVLGVGEEIAAKGSTCDYCSMRERCHYRDHYIHVEKT
jgi:hypothetical protein